MAQPLLLNAGGGTFVDGSNRLNSSVAAHTVAAGDIDGDRDVDLVFGGSVHLNQGGSFTAAPNAWRPSAGDILDLALFDADQDGDLDLFEARGDGSEWSFRLGTADQFTRNDGRGHFRPGVVAPIPAATQAGGAALGDLDGDGDLDAVMVGPGSFMVMSNPGDGLLQLTAAIAYSGLSPGGSGTDGVLGDFDGDGDLDAVVDGLAIYLNTATGWVATPYRQSQYAGLTRLQLADLDLVCGNGCYASWLSCNRFTGSPREIVMWNDGRGGLGSEQDLTGGLSNTRATAVCDVDEDGDVDVVFGNVYDPNTPIDQLVLNDGNRSFREARSYPPVVEFPYDGLDLASTVVVGIFGPPRQGRRIGLDPTVPRDPSLLDATLWWQSAVLANGSLRLTNVVADRIGW